MALKLGNIAFDCDDVPKVATLWSTVLGTDSYGSPAAHAIAEARSANGKCLTSPGVIHPNNAVMWVIHSMSVTSAMRFQARRCSTPILRSCHSAPAERPSKSAMTMTQRMPLSVAARSSAGSRTSR
jgi:hypothetical protein